MNPDEVMKLQAGQDIVYTDEFSGRCQVCKGSIQGINKCLGGGHNVVIMWEGADRPAIYSYNSSFFKHVEIAPNLPKDNPNRTFIIRKKS